MSIVANVYNPPLDGFAKWASDLAEYRDNLKPPGTNGLFGCDFYALTNYSDHVVAPPALGPDGWIAWQYHNGSINSPCASDRGVVLAFRRVNGSTTPSSRSFSLRGVVAARIYAVTAWNNSLPVLPTKQEQEFSGAELRTGLILSLAPHTSAVVTYRCVK